jgi:methylenetetrahydrofolate dehydrogenase (NADP+)/methenyltetrahydrofolate cyclohydrolase
MTYILDGKAVAARLRDALTQDVTRMTQSGNRPGLSVILVGDDAASDVYVRNKIAACQKTGIQSFEHRLPRTTQQSEIADLIARLNADPAVHGILLQLPLPEHLDSTTLINLIAPHKDVDGLHPLNLGRLMSGEPGTIPCTPQGALLLIKEAEQNLSGLHALIIGRSILFGKPMAQLLLRENCTVTQAHSKTRNLPALCRQADILIAATGQAEMVKGDWIKPDSIVIDVGITRMKDGTLKGDVDFAAAQSITRAITPVPGGVGPMTIACLLKNTVLAAAKE